MMSVRVLAGLALLLAAVSAAPPLPDGASSLNALQVAAEKSLFAVPSDVSIGKTLKTPTDLLHKFGYPSEVHEVVTEDGYILRLDRIPNKGRPVAYIAHGLQTSASAFILLGKNNSLALVLYDAGYDVWLANFRGSVYSTKHQNFTSKDPRFWEFGWHENGYYDNPANIDYILRETGQKDLLYTGHSMGSTSFLVMGATRPEHLKKVRAAFLASPASYFQHSKSPIFDIIGIPVKLYEILFHTRVKSSSTWYYHFLGNVASVFCPIFDGLCAAAINAIVGYRPHDAFWKDIPDFFDYVPCGGSTGQILHYMQQAFDRKSEFRMYDFGSDENMKKYGQRKPPLYELSNINIPVYIYNGANDILCEAKDMTVLKSKLPNLKKELITKDRYFNHMDPMVAEDAGEQMFYEMVQDMAPYSQGKN